MQLLFFRKEVFGSHLRRRDVSALLARAGYLLPFTPEHIIEQLRVRIAAGPFPHEIGVLLGYPTWDVAAFMGWLKLPFACQGPWKMFGNPARSKTLALTFLDCRRRMAKLLMNPACAPSNMFDAPFFTK